ncbi:serine/threonine protein kinase, partial [Streptomyces sp. SID7499]|nr:serine/threonine protein kinase [Streptomyces sp. SID7499]
DGTAQAEDTKGASPKGTEKTDGEGERSEAVPASPDLHSGHKLAGRYRLEECVTRLDGFSSWRAVDEKLRRAVGVHLLPADHPRARSVLAAARSSALLGDPRFVQVLDA